MSISNPTHKDRAVWERNSTARAARQETELIGLLSAIKWSDPESGAIIAQLRTGEIVKGECEEGEIEVGMTYRFLGKWQHHNKWGAQFSFGSFVHHTPASEQGVTRYLALTARNVGQVTASRLWGKYGGQAVEILRADPARVVSDGIMSEADAEEASRDLLQESGMEATKLDLFALFDGRGFPRRLIKDVIRRWGAKAAQVIRRNPFRLLIEEFGGCGFIRCDKLYLDLGLPRAALKRQMLCAWNSLRESNTGSTWTLRGTAVRAIRGAMGEGTARPNEAIALGIRSGWLAVTTRGGKEYIAEGGKAKAERSLADSIRHMQKWPLVLWPAPAALDPRVSDHQRAAYEKLSTARVAILDGSPGTGKTFLAAAIIRAVVAMFGRDCVAVAAPTGIAAVRITAAMQGYGIDLAATTIHRLLEIGRNGHGDGNWGFQRNASNPLPCRFLFVDELSMLDCSLAASLFSACAPGTHVLGIGDVGQLPPVGHGAPLRDLIASGIVPVGSLSEIKRQQNGSVSMIVKACADIRDGRPFETCERYDPDAGADLKLVECATPQEQVETLCKVLAQFQASGKFDPVRDCQVLVAVNEKSLISRVTLNATLQGLLNPAAEDEATEGGGKKTLWRVDDKIICLRNCWIEGMRLSDRSTAPRDSLNAWEQEYDHAPVQHFLANGDQGFVLAVGDGALVAEFAGPTPRIVRVPLAKKEAVASGAAGEGGAKGGSAGDFALAYAVTVWKSQGNQFPVAISMVDDAAGPGVGVEFHYTAWSRASKLCIILGKRSTLLKQVRKVTLRLRKTFLTSLLKGEPEDVPAPALASAAKPCAAVVTIATDTTSETFIRKLLEDL